MARRSASSNRFSLLDFSKGKRWLAENPGCVFSAIGLAAVLGVSIILVFWLIVFLIKAALHLLL